MKKGIFLGVCALFAFTTLDASVFVRQGNQTVAYKDGSIVQVDGTVSTIVNYNGIDIFIPQGTAVRLAAANNNMVAVSGRDLRGLQMMGVMVVSQGETVLLADPAANTISVQEGVIQVTSHSGEKAVVNKGYKVIIPRVVRQNPQQNQQVARPATNKPATQQPAKPAATADETDTFIVLEDFVATDFSNVNFQQAVEDQTLSPSAPGL